MKATRFPLLSIATVSIVGCAGSVNLEKAVNTADLVEVSRVVNSLKCGIARAVVSDTEQRSGIFGATAVVKLQMNVVTGSNSGGGISLASTGIPVFQGAKVEASLNSSSNVDRTFNTTVDFEIDATTTSDNICLFAGEPVSEDGFSNWLLAQVHDINRIAAGRPFVAFSGYKYETDFTVTKTLTAGGELSFSIIPVSVDGTVSNTRKDVQHITITVQPVHFVHGRTGKTKKPKSKLFSTQPALPVN